ncbi:MAG: hypothetical protein Q8936_23980 [Bacillota bacterium]|nr:hypothetical protein [Bacillota bacterium]
MNEKNINENLEEASKVVTPQLTDKEIDKLSVKAGQDINTQNKVTIRIPTDKLNKNDVVVPVCVNGYNFFINRGEKVEVPEIVADILMEAGYI